MARPALTNDDITAFRTRLAEASFRVFSRLGHAGLTLRAVAAELGVSAMTPYRYVADKDELLALARAEVFRQFADGQEAAAARGALPFARFKRLCRAYVSFALERPDAYRLMFSSVGPVTACAELAAQAARAFQPLLDATKAAVDMGLERGDPRVLAHLHWASVHGLVSLHLNGTLAPGMRLEKLCDDWLAGLNLERRKR